MKFITIIMVMLTDILLLVKKTSEYQLVNIHKHKHLNWQVDVRKFNYQIGVDNETESLNAGTDVSLEKVTMAGIICPVGEADVLIHIEESRFLSDNCFGKHPF